MSYRRNPTVVRICIFCKKEFIPNSGKQVCCSQLCNANKWRKLNPEKAKIQQKKNDEKRKGKKRYNSEGRKKWYAKKKTNLKWKEKRNILANARRNAIQTFLRDYKIMKGCADCGYKEHHAALDFDHVRGNKKINVCNAKSIQQAQKEIEKCDVVCANCHRIRTFKRLEEKLHDSYK